MPRSGVDVNRCTFVRTTGERCRKSAMTGLDVCRAHGGQGKYAREKSARAKLAQFARPISEDDAEANPYVGFLTDYRRTVARIRYFDEKIIELKSEKDLVWGVTEEKYVGSGEFPGTDVTKQAKMNVYYEAQFRERQHLLNLTKIWIGANLEEKRLSIQASIVDQLQQSMDAVVVELGYSPKDPKVRQAVYRALGGLGTAVGAPELA